MIKGFVICVGFLFTAAVHQGPDRGRGDPDRYMTAMGTAAGEVHHDEASVNSPVLCEGRVKLCWHV